MRNNRVFLPIRGWAFRIYHRIILTPRSENTWGCRRSAASCEFGGGAVYLAIGAIYRFGYWTVLVPYAQTSHYSKRPQIINLLVADTTTNPINGSSVTASARAVIGEGWSVVVVDGVKLSDCPITPHRPSDAISKAIRHFNMIVGI